MDTLMTFDPVLVHAAAGTMACIFLLGAMAKLWDIPLFMALMENYGLLPRWLLKPVAWLLPLCEATAGVLLLPVGTRFAGACLALVLLAIVSGAVAINLVRGQRRIDCGCGGDSLELSEGLLARNAALAVLLIVAMQSPAARQTVWLDMVSTLMATVFLLGLIKAVNLWLGHQSRLHELRNTP
ncbi:MauE/DoxX family redox-associated membrane protein [Variovorax sp. J22R133]|uniref:MauE/DoxX family redox-associated membrane protein n=1 Tax=Variovorax brevis TaxID=3053503 RepID=UPI00257807DD|nr:MauE/DoxX family redox-associated membrane protein [Variovorax sp. J22R133]MDM0111445.1 MauE/DoxX family redox-associated membrane protein [Variovorax sp. J22R133]